MNLNWFGTNSSKRNDTQFLPSDGTLYKYPTNVVPPHDSGTIQKLKKEFLV